MAVVVELANGDVEVNFGANGSVSGASSLTTLNRLTKVTATGTIGMATIAESAITGVLTITKTGTTARTATFPDAAITVAGSASALTSGRVPYVTTGGLLTDSAVLTYAANALSLVGSSGSCTMTIGSAAATLRGLLLNTASSLRFFVGLSTAAETGSDAGSNYRITAYTDAGASIDTPFEIVRAAGGAITLARPVTCTGAVTVPNGTAAAPGIRLTSEASGLYRVSSTSLGFAVAGTAIASLSSAGTLTVNAALNSTGGLTINNTDAGTGASANVLLQNDLGAAARFNIGVQSSGYTGPVFGVTAANYCSFLTVGASTAGILFGNASTSSPIIFGSAGIEIARFSSGTLATGSLQVKYTSVASLALSGGMTLAAIAAATTAGGFQRETNQDAFYGYANAIGGWLDKCIFSQYASVTQSGIVTDQSLASATARGTRTLPANFFKAGKVLKFRLCGRYTTDVAAGNATIQIKLGTTVFRTSGSFALDNSSTNLPWEIEGEIVCLTTGATGTVEGISLWKHMITGATSNYDAEALSGSGSVTIDTTASQTFDVIWTATDAGTTITCTCFRLWEVC